VESGRTFNLETAVGSQKSAQALGAPRKIIKCLITYKVTTNFFISPCTPIPYASFLRPTAVSRFNQSLDLFLLIPTIFYWESIFSLASFQQAFGLISPSSFGWVPALYCGNDGAEGIRETSRTSLRNPIDLSATNL
jgi:hypothetical protein